MKFNHDGRQQLIQITRDKAQNELAALHCSQVVNRIVGVVQISENQAALLIKNMPRLRYGDSFAYTIKQRRPDLILQCFDSLA